MENAAFRSVGTFSSLENGNIQVAKGLIVMIGNQARITEAENGVWSCRVFLSGTSRSPAERASANVTVLGMVVFLQHIYYYYYYSTNASGGWVCTNLLTCLWCGIFCCCSIAADFTETHGGYHHGHCWRNDHN